MNQLFQKQEVKLLLESSEHKLKQSYSPAWTQGWSRVSLGLSRVEDFARSIEGAYKEVMKVMHLESKPGGYMDVSVRESGWDEMITRMGVTE